MSLSVKINPVCEKRCITMTFSDDSLVTDIVIMRNNIKLADICIFYISRTSWFICSLTVVLLHLMLK